MSVIFLHASEKTNSYRPGGWGFSEEPFPAIRGYGYYGKVFFPFVASCNDIFENIVSEEYTNGKTIQKIDGHFDIITTKKGTNILIPCEKSEYDILFITGRGGFRGGYSHLPTGDGVVFIRDGNKHCCPIFHAVVKLKKGEYVFSETGRRSMYGTVEIYSADGIKEMTSEEFEFIEQF